MEKEQFSPCELSSISRSNSEKYLMWSGEALLGPPYFLLSFSTDSKQRRIMSLSPGQSDAPKNQTTDEWIMNSGFFLLRFSADR